MAASINKKSGNLKKVKEGEVLGDGDDEGMDDDGDDGEMNDGGEDMNEDEVVNMRSKFSRSVMVLRIGKFM